MLKIKKTNLTKKNISNKINQRTGFSNSYTNKEINIKNFGTLKL